MRPISTFLQQLIDEANESLATSKEKILYVYNQSIAEDYTPKEARKLVQEKIVNVSTRYLQELLPLEAKREYTAREDIISDQNDFVSEQVRKQNESRHITEIEPTTPIIIEPEEEQPALAPYTAVEELQAKIEEFEMRHERDEKRIQNLVGDVMKLQNEFLLTEQLLKEERAKTSELEQRIELREREYEATLTLKNDKITHLDTLTDKLSAQLQEQSRKLTTLSMQQDNAIPEPPTEQNYSIEADVAYDSKKLPVVVRCYISGKKIGWIDRETYKARYGKEPREE